MHPITKNFIYSSERLSSIVEKNINDKQHLESVFLKLVKTINQDQIDPQIFLDIDSAILKGHPDASVYFLFVSFVIYFICKRNQIVRANVIHSIGVSLSIEKLDPTLQSYFFLSTAALKHYEGKFNERDLLLKKSMVLIERKSPRYRTILYGLAFLKSQEGRLNDLNQEDLEMIDAPSNEEQKIVGLDLRLANYIFTGNFEEGSKLLSKYQSSFNGNISFIPESKISLIKILKGDFNDENFQDKRTKLYVSILNAFAKGKLAEAMNLYQKLQSNKTLFVQEFPFEEYFQLNYELCTKNKGMARFIIQENVQKRNLRYFDDFYFARLQLLEMNRTGAAESFRRLMKNVEHYGALNRLQFEIQFAHELEPSDIMNLMNSLDEEEIVTDLTLNKEEVEPKKRGIKGVQLLIGKSPAISKVKELILIFASLKDPVLISGETGTGKEVVARAIHAEGKNSKDPFLAINCGSLTESLLQSELFGYVAGAFTGAQREKKGIFEAAGKGTVFLDEFGGITPQMQVSLLRVIESNEIRLIGGTKTRLIECKIVIATNVDLQKAVEEKKFREDLYFRLTRFDIKLPPLRERNEDIPLLIEHFLENKKALKGKQQSVAQELIDILKNYGWPGNIRELKNEMERLGVLHADKEILNREDFDFTRLQGFTLKTPVHKEIAKAKESISESFYTKELNISKEQILKIVERGSIAENRERIFKELFKKYKKLTRSQIVEIININPGTATKELQGLCKSGFIRKLMPTKSVKSHYFELVE